MTLDDKVVAVKDLTALDPHTMIPYPVVTSGMEGKIIRVLERQIGATFVRGICVEFTNGASIAMMEHADGSPMPFHTPIKEQIRLA